jgi:outer membrane protein assembly factor BamB
MRTNLILYALYLLALALAICMESFADYQPTNDENSTEAVPPIRNVTLEPQGDAGVGEILFVTPAGDLFAMQGATGIATYSAPGVRMAVFPEAQFVGGTASGNAIIKNFKGEVREVSANGETVWRGQVPAVTASSAASADGRVYIISNWSLYAIAPRQGILWHWDSPARPYRDTALEWKNVETSLGGHVALDSDGTIYLDQGRLGKIIAFNPSGEQLWEVHLAAGLGQMVPDSKGRIYIASNDLVAINRQGLFLWRYAAPVNPLFFGDNTPVVSPNGNVYLSRRSFFCVGQDGKERWRFHPDTPEEYFTIPATLGRDGTVYLYSSGTKHRIYALSQEGKKKWSYQVGGGFVGAPMHVVADGSLWKAIGNGFLVFSANNK